MDIEVLLLIEKASGEDKIIYLFTDAPSDQAMELFITTSGSDFVLYHTDIYYDNVMRQRRQSDNMILTSKRERLLFVGLVWNDVPINLKDYIILSKSIIPSEKIRIDEK